MSYKLTSKLTNFKFNRHFQSGPLAVEWFFYNHYDNEISVNQDREEENSRGFTFQELQQFQAYATSNATNFIGDKNYLTVFEGEEPYISPLDFSDDGSVSFPENLVLIPDAIILPVDNVARIMKVQLLDANGKNNHNYHLPFCAIGRIIGA